MMRGLVLAFVGCAVGTAHADFADHVANDAHLERARVRDATAYELPKGTDYTYVILGRYDAKTLPVQIFTAVILERCTTHACIGKLVSLIPGDTFEVLGLVDLAGAPGPFPTIAVEAHRVAAIPLPAPPRMLHPALVLRHGGSTTTTEANRQITDSRESITLLSLERRSDPIVFSTVVREHATGGAGQTTSLRFDRSGAAGFLSIIASKKIHLGDESGCIPPKPLDTRWHFDGAQYIASAIDNTHSGCY